MALLKSIHNKHIKDNTISPKELMFSAILPVKCGKKNALLE